MSKRQVRTQHENIHRSTIQTKPLRDPHLGMKFIIHLISFWALSLYYPCHLKPIYCIEKHATMSFFSNLTRSTILHCVIGYVVWMYTRFNIFFRNTMYTINNSNLRSHADRSSHSTISRTCLSRVGGLEGFRGWCQCIFFKLKRIH